MRRAKTQLKLNLAATVKGNKIISVTCISNRRRVKENPLLDVGGKQSDK